MVGWLVCRVTSGLLFSWYQLWFLNPAVYALALSIHVRSINSIPCGQTLAAATPSNPCMTPHAIAPLRSAATASQSAAAGPACWLNPGDAAKLDRFERRFVWFKSRLEERKEVSRRALLAGQLFQYSYALAPACMLRTDGGPVSAWVRTTHTPPGLANLHCPPQ